MVAHEMVGSLRLEAVPSSDLHVMAFDIYSNAFPEFFSQPIAIMWKLSLTPEWQVYCHACPPPPSDKRGNGRTASFLSKERAIQWYSHHLSNKHRRASNAK